jgi:hypothetical protein
VQIQGSNKHNQPFIETAQMLCVSAHGGLVALSAALEKGATIVVTNRGTDEQQEARVVFIGHAPGRKFKVGFEFVGAAANFWRVNFPLTADKPLKFHEYEKVAV